MMGAPRVNGRLQVTRSLGDMQLRPYVSQELQLVRRGLEEGDAFVVVASDGLWDAMKIWDVCGQGM